MSSKRSINPETKFVFKLNTSYLHNKFWTIYGPDAFPKCKEYIDMYIEKAGKKIASIKQRDSGGVLVCMCDEFMGHVHAVNPQSSQIIFVGATGSLE